MKLLLDIASLNVISFFFSSRQVKRYFRYSFYYKQLTWNDSQDRWQKLGGTLVSVAMHPYPKKGGDGIYQIHQAGNCTVIYT